MSIKSVLVPVGGAHAEHAVEAAMLAAQRTGAHVAGLHVRPEDSDLIPRSFTDGMSAGAMSKMVSELRDAASQREAAARRLFETVRDRHGLETRIDPPGTGAASASWRVASGNEADVASGVGRVFDLVVCGRPLEGSQEPSMTTLEACLFHSGSPVLAAPRASLAHIGKRVVVTWNRAQYAARAVAGALAFLAAAEEVVLLHVATGAKEGPPVEDLARRLAWHGIETTLRQVPLRGHGTSELIVDETARLNADLLVLGAYSHTRFREAVLGGVTRYILYDADIPVIMSH